MKYNFKDILNQDIYDNTRVMVITGRYQIFNNLVADTLKEMSVERTFINGIDLGLADEFGIEDDDSTVSTSVDIDTFFDVVNVSNINGKWFCRVGLESINKKQKDKILNYIKQPSKNGILVLMSTDFKDYKDFLKNKSLQFGQYAHLMQLSFPNKVILKSIVENMFNELGIEVDNQALEHFVMRLNTEYDEYEKVITDIKEKHKESKLNYSDMKSYLKGIEYFDIDDFMSEIVKPLTSGKTGNKKIIRMLSSLRDKYSAEDLVFKLQEKIEELIEYRILINKGYVTINIRYIFNDVLKLLGPDSKYQKVNEWVFRKKADLASMTSLEDWIYMNIMLTKALSIGFPGTPERKFACERVLYDLVTRSVLSADRINNITGLDNILNKTMLKLDRIKYNEQSLDEIFDNNEDDYDIEEMEET